MSSVAMDGVCWHRSLVCGHPRTGFRGRIVRVQGRIVDVQCHKPGGLPEDSRFTVLWTVSSGVLPSTAGSYASVQYGPAVIVHFSNPPP